MKQIKLNRLEIENFRAIKSLTVDFTGRNTEFRGKNGLGKTTAADSYAWILTGKFLTGKDVGSLCKPLDKNNQSDRNTITSVTAHLEIDGAPLVLKKTLQEKWTRPTGQEQAVLSTHTTICTVNGQEKAIGEYEKYLDAICPRGIWLMLSAPSLFLGMKEDQQRKILLDMSGEAGPEEVCKLDPMLKPLLPVLTEKDPITGQTRSIEAVKKSHQDARNKAEKERDGIPALINAHKSHLKETPAGDHAGNVVLRSKRLQDLQTERAGAASAGTGALKLEIGKLELAMTGIETSYRSQGNPAREQALAKERELTEQIQKLTLDVKNREALILADEEKAKTYKSQIDRGNARLDEIEEQQEALRSEPFLPLEYVGEGTCFNCKQPLPKEMIEGDRAKFDTDQAEAEKKFNLGRANRLKALDDEFDKILDDGKATKAKLEEIEASIKSAMDDHATTTGRLVGARTNLSHLVIPEATTASHLLDKEYIKLGNERDALQLKIEKFNADSSKLSAELDAKIETAQGLLDEAKGYVEAAKGNLTTQEKIGELELREKELTKQVTEAEKLMYLCDQYARAWCGLMNDKINAPFKVVRWKLFEPLMKGGIEMVTKCLYATTGAPPSEGQVIECGIEIAKVLQAHYGLSVPVWIDGAERFTGEIDIPTQWIALRAVKGMEQLQIVFEGDEKQIIGTVNGKPVELIEKFGNTDEYAQIKEMAPEMEKAFKNLQYQQDVQSAIAAGIPPEDIPPRSEPTENRVIEKTIPRPESDDFNLQPSTTARPSLGKPRRRI